jgi:hypothetical protein
MFNQTENLGSGCMLPLLQSIAGGVITALLAFAVAYGAQWRLPWLFALATGAGAAVLWYWSTVALWRRSAYPQPETTLPDQPRQTPVVRVEVLKDDGRGMEFIDLPANPDQLINLARGVLQGQTLSESSWTGSNGIFTRSEFSALRGELLKRGLACWNNPQTPARGVSLTRGGLAAMRTFAAMTDLPTPQASQSKSVKF